jgi:hypothetical protein
MKGLARRLSATLALVLGAALITATSAFSAEQLVQISSDPYTNTTSNHKTEVEPDSFAFGNTIVAAFQVGRFFDGGASNIGFATSTDRGSTWTHGFLPSSTVFATPAGPFQRASDPSVAFDAKHKVWLISWLGLHPLATGIVDVLVSRSTDGGLTWGAPVVVNASGDFNDKNWTKCDDTATSPFYGRCYTEFDDFSKLNLFQMSTSKDGGLTWGAAKTNPSHTCVIGGQPVVQPNGTVIVPIDDCFETAIFSIMSTDGGKTWTDPVLVAQIINNGHPGAIRSPDLPSAQIDKSGRVYVVWTDCRFEAFCAAPIGTNDLLLTSSADGISWTLPKRIPAAAVGSGADHLLPGLGVDRNSSGGAARLGLVYYFFPNSNCTITTCELNVRFISSTNGGRSWSAAETLAGPMTMTWLPLTTQGFMVGDYFATAIPPGRDIASPIFAVAKAPTPPPNCSNLKTGAPGQGCDQAMFTTPEGLLSIVGGSNAATEEVPAAAAAPTAPAAAPGGTSRLTARAIVQ